MIRATLASLAAIVCLWSEIARSQELQNGVWTACDGLAYPSLQVPDGQARLEFEVTSVRATRELQCDCKRGRTAELSMAEK
jgi:hypothetical protein